MVKIYARFNFQTEIKAWYSQLVLAERLPQLDLAAAKTDVRPFLKEASHTELITSRQIYWLPMGQIEDEAID